MNVAIRKDNADVAEDTSSAPPNTTADRSIPINHYHPQTPHHENS
jgi:hypothetical protein